MAAPTDSDLLAAAIAWLTGGDLVFCPWSYTGWECRFKCRLIHNARRRMAPECWREFFAGLWRSNHGNRQDD